MIVMTNLCALTLRQLIGGACKALGVPVGEAAVADTSKFLARHFIDQSGRLQSALERSTARAWKALEIALAGNSVWDRCKLLFASGEEKAFREQIKPFLDACPLAELQGKDTFRQQCLQELRAAEKTGVLKEGNLDPHELARRTGAFARFADPQGLLDAEFQALEQMGDELRKRDYANLGSFITLRPQNGQPLLIIAARYFFRRAVEEDSALFQGLSFAQLESLQQAQEAAFDALNRTLVEQAGKLERILSDVQVVVTATHEKVLDLVEEQRRQGQQHQDMYRAVIDLQKRLDMLHREVRPADSLSLRTDQERRLVKELVSRYRNLPEDSRRELPALLNAIGKIEIAAGDFQAAQQDFDAVAQLVADPKAQAEAHYNAYQAALERREWDTALKELQEAVRLDAPRFAPFPVDKFIPQRILGAGGFGVAFLCRHRFLKTDVVVKTLLGEDLDRDVDELFGEAQTLRQLDHPAIIRLQDCGFASGESRPYLVMDYFDGTTLEAAAQERALQPEELLAVAQQMASGLQAAHGKGILHRDVKPANVLVRRPREPGEAWQVKLIDFGLALRKSMRETVTAASAQTMLGSSIAGTMEYAAPEQMGKLPGVPVSPASDVYGFARTCCYALFQTPQPLLRHWRSVPQGLAELLETCLEEKPDNRPRDFTAVLERLPGRRPGAPSVPPPPGHIPLPTVSEPSGPLQPLAGPVSEMMAEQRLQELSALQQHVAGCIKCTQLAFGRTQTVFGTGPLDPDIMLLGEAPGADEDRRGEPFIGAAGQLLMGLLADLGMRREDVYISNLLKCRPPGNRQPLPQETRNCREYLDRQIELIRPKSLVAMGSTAAQQLLNTAESISRMRGRIYVYKNIPVLCTYHPAFLLPGRSPEKRRDVLEDFRTLLRRLGKKV